MKKKVVSIVFVIIAIIAIVCVSKKVQQKKYIASLDAENLRAMSYEQLAEDDRKTQSNNVEFSAFFLRDVNNDGYADRLKGTCKNVDGKDILYAELNVRSGGYLEGGVITLNATNFVWSTSIVKDNIVGKNYIGNTDEIKLADKVYAGSQKLLTGDIFSRINYCTDNYSKVSSMTLTGTYVGDDGSRTPINKTLEFTVDWYGEVETYLETHSQSYNISGVEQSENEIGLNFYIYNREQNGELLLKDNVINAVIPPLNGYSATRVEVLNSSATSKFDVESGKLEIINSSKVNEENYVTSSISRTNQYYIKVYYPKEAYDLVQEDTIILEIPVEGYYTGYNNPNNEFSNAIKPNIAQSNIASGVIAITFSNPKGDLFNCNVRVGEYTYSKILGYHTYIMLKQNALNVYNGILNDKEDLYNVEWYFTVNDYDYFESAILKDTKADEMSDNSGNKYSMADFSSNVGIYFKSVASALGQEGYINVYDDDTDELIHTFTNKDWNMYNSTKPYLYERPIKHIRVETSKVNGNSTFYVENVKSINDEELVSNISKEDFDKIDSVYSYLTGQIKLANGQEESVDRANYAHYLEQSSNITLEVSPYKTGISEQEKHMNILVNTLVTNTNETEWKDGEFLLKLPPQIISAEISSIESNNKDVKIVGYDLYQQDGVYYIKVITENEIPATYRISIGLNYYLDITSPTTYETVELYSYNKINNNYVRKADDIYDVNGNNNVDEKVGYTTDSVSFVAPSTLLTNQVVSNYDDEGNITVSPNVAQIKKEQRSANIDVNIINNYSRSVTDIVVVGETPYKGNTYMTTNTDLGSQFTAEMTNPGISVPEELEGKVKIYYSTNTNATKDLNDPNNLWTENPEDWSAVRRYLIDFQDCVMSAKTSYKFTYGVYIPENIHANEISYTEHIIYFAINTDEGKLLTQTEPGKLGIRITEKYSIDLQKFKKGTSLVVPGATYKIVELDDDNNEVSSKMLTTDTNGRILYSELMAGRKYKLFEIKAPENYVINDDEIEFKVSEDETGNLEVIILSEDTFAGEHSLSKNSEGNYVLSAKVEDEPKYRIVINKTDVNSGNKLKNVVFKFEDAGKESNYITDSNGQVNIKGLILGKTYTISEIRNDDYYVDSTERAFSVIRNEQNKLQIVSDDEFISNAEILDDESEDNAVLNINITNEKIPTYSLEALKVQENDDSNVGLEGAIYRLTSKDTGKTQYYRTDENGKLTINNLYLYVDGKYITGEYTLEEFGAPEGYSRNREKITFVTSIVDGQLNISINNKNNLTTLKDVTTEGNKVKLILQDKPLFKLTKRDVETNIPLAGVKFVIYSITPSKEVIGYAKDVNGNFIGTKDSSNRYVIETDENGEIILALPGGYYKIIEVETGKEYYLSPNVDDRTNYFKVEGGVQIATIEDLMDFAISVREGKTYDGENVELLQTLDFQNNDSYSDPGETRFGDLNGDDVNEGLKIELMKAGFPGTGEENSFQGTFNGNGNQILNFSGGYIFNKIQNAEIKNLEINYCSDGEYKDISTGLIKEATYSQINNCYSTGNLMIQSSTSGLVKTLVSSQMNKCYNSAAISSNSYAAGLVEEANSSTITNCYNSGIINSTRQSSGIAHKTEGCTIRNCYNTAVIEANGESGGLILEDTASYIEKCYNDGNIIGCNVAGILLRADRSSGSDNDTIKDCYNTGTLTSTSIGSSSYQNHIGGIITVSCKNIINCHNTGSISINNKNNTNYVGGIASIMNSSNKRIVNCSNVGKIDTCRGYTGGIVGLVNSTTNIVGCLNSGNITVATSASSNSIQVGGIIGLQGAYNSVVKFCGNKGTIMANSSDGNVGGIIGHTASPTNIENSCNIASLTLKSGYVGGISGKISPPCVLKNVFNSGKVELYESDGYIGAITGLYESPQSSESNYIYYLEGCANKAFNVKSGMPESLIEVSPISKSQSEFSSVSGLLEQNRSDNQNYDGFHYTWNYSSMTVVDIGIGKVISTISRDMSPLPFNTNYNTFIEVKPVVLDSVKIDDSIDFSDATEITVDNMKKRFSITTEIAVNSDGERAGGTITGEYNEKYPEEKYKQFVEEVIYGEDSLQEIKIVPEEKYVVTKIKVNGKEINFVADENGVVTLPIFNDVIEDKHIQVIFEKDMSRVIVHHYLKDENGNLTTNKVAEDQTYTGKIDDPYATSPHIDLEKLRLEIDEGGELVLPENAVGIYTTETQIVNYYYVADPIILTVHHYLDGTETKLADDEIYTYESHVEFNDDGTYKVLANGEYDVSESKAYEDLTKMYNLTIVTSTIKDTVNFEDMLNVVTDSEVSYYYTLKQFEISTEVKPHTESRTDELSNEKQDVEVKGGTISGETVNPYEIVEYGNNSKKEIKVTPDNNYRAKTITLISVDENNNETETIIYGENADENAEISYTVNEDGEVILSNFNNVKENKHIVVEFEPIPGTVIVHHYIVGTGEENGKEAVKVPMQNGGVAEDVYKHDLIGERYITQEMEGIKSIYKLVSTSSNTTGKYTEDVINVYYYYDYNDYEYTVEYYYENKETRAFDKDEDLTEHNLVKYGEVIEDYITKLKDGYALDREENLPLTITEIVENNVIKIYYRLAEYNYTVEYYYENKDSHEYVKDEDATERIGAEFNDIIVSYKEKMKQGYELDKTENLPLIVTSNEENNVIKVYYGLKDYKYTINYFFDGVKDDTLTEEKTAEYSDVINNYIDKVREGYVLDKVDNLPLTITINEEDNVINVYYITAYNITTDVIEHIENYKDGTTKTVKGGTISGEDLASYEKVGKGKQNTKAIVMTPSSGYQIVKVLINNENYDFKDNIKSDKTLTIPDGYFTDMQSDKHIDVEFRKTTKVVVTHILRKPDGTTEVYKTEELPGYEGQEYDTSRLVIDKYVASKDDDGNIVPANKSGNMKADTINVTYYYEKVSYGVIERHMEVDEKGNEREIESQSYTGYEGQSANTKRKHYDGLIPVNCKVQPEEGIIAMTKSEDAKSVNFGEEIAEVRYYYEKQFKISTEVKTHTETKDGVETQVKGGGISGEGQSAYEYVLNRGKNSKAIIITPDSKYKVKSISINGEIVEFTENKNHIVTLKAGYFDDVKSNYHVVVEFEKIPAKVTVRYVYKVTGEDILSPTEIMGVVDDEYTTTRQEIEDYFADGDPQNPTGTMTEEDIVVIYYYNKQFKITTDVIEHKELDKRLIELPKKETDNIKTILVSGGTISGEDEDPYEFVMGGESSTKDIIMVPHKGYKIVMVKINGVVQDLSKIVKDDGTVKLDYFTEMKEDKHIEVQYEKVTAKLVVKYLEEGTDRILAEEERATAHFNDEYILHSKEIKGYKLVKSPNKQQGIVLGDVSEVYYYVLIKEEPKDNTDIPVDPTDEKDLQNYSAMYSENKTNTVKTGDNVISSVISIIVSVCIMQLAIIMKKRK